MNYRPTITTTERNGKLAIWINLPDGRQYNVWDMPREDALLYMKAIRRAFELGAESIKQQLSEVRVVAPTLSLSTDIDTH